MGYLSDVIIIIPSTAYNRLKTKISAVKKPEKKKDIMEFFSYATIMENNKSHDVLIEWKGVKWYPSDQDMYYHIYVIEKFLNELSDGEYRFIRIGEELGDIEQYGSYYENSFCDSVEVKVKYRKRNCSTVIFC